MTFNKFYIINYLVLIKNISSVYLKTIYLYFQLNHMVAENNI